MKRNNKILLILLLAIFILPIMSSCTRRKTEHVDIYASIYPLYYLTTNIVGDKLSVGQVYPNGTDVHEYDPIADGEMRNLLEMNNAKLMFYVGAGLEAFIENAKKTVFTNSDLKLVQLSNDIKMYDSVTEEKEDDLAIGHALTVDVHVWLDPIIMVEFAKKIEKEIVEIDYENEEYYKENLEKLITKLMDIDTKYKETLESKENKTMIVDHDAYLYLAKRYGITRIKTRTDNESCDMTPSKLIEAIDKVKELNLKYIVATKNEMVCSSVNSIQTETGAEVVYLDPIATLSNESKNKDYYQLMMENLTVLNKIFK